MIMSSRADRNLRLALAENATVLDVSAVDADVKDGSTLYIGTGGNIKVDTIGGDTVIFYNVFDGSFLPVSVAKVYSADTTASNILALS